MDMSLSGISRLTDQFTAEITADLGVLMNSFYISTTNEEINSLSGKFNPIAGLNRVVPVSTYMHPISADERNSQDERENYPEAHQCSNNAWISPISHERRTQPAAQSDLVAEIQELRARVAAQDEEIEQLIQAIRDDADESGAHLAGDPSCEFIPRI